MFDGTRSNELSPSPLLHRPWSVLQVSKTHARQNGTLRIYKIHADKFCSRCNAQFCGRGNSLGGLGLCHAPCHARSPRIATSVAAASLQHHKPLASGAAPCLFDTIPAMTPRLDVLISHPLLHLSSSRALRNKPSVNRQAVSDLGGGKITLAGLKSCGADQALTSYWWNLAASHSTIYLHPAFRLPRL